MKTEILLFGRLTELLGHERISVEDIYDTDTLRKYLLDQYPVLLDVKYHIAVNQQSVQTKKTITDGMIVALMPPFSGG